MDLLTILSAFRVVEKKLKQKKDYFEKGKLNCLHGYAGNFTD